MTIESIDTSALPYASITNDHAILDTDATVLVGDPLLGHIPDMQLHPG